MIKNRMVFVLLLSIWACKTENRNEANAQIRQSAASSEVAGLTTAETIISNAIQAHGGTLYDTAHYSFTFRKKEYTFNNDNGYEYTLEDNTGAGTLIVDELKNGIFTRQIDGETVVLNQKDTAKYSQALNSVIYFAMLPYKLMDKAVIKKYVGETFIKNQKYDIVEVTFKENGGGNDFDDEFHYWINKETKTMDYLAYNYRVNEGGVRFRSAYNRRNVNGIIFQDYINWEAPIRTPLRDLPSLYEKGSLKELSRIETKNVLNLK
ncbi:DUF6503 family protein [Costertonia aggregata]|uniref:Deoxyribose-phosphate aldolase n=1 Tax=Costertonia aggregata TaxID=343403 RepID=A0A7H9AL59_9FLAO|nr:DUF6503 family protein [Costertonia aggregata]QLG44196.1 hypothetical protein HYG79_02145 [Costertonia aggregata]